MKKMVKLILVVACLIMTTIPVGAADSIQTERGISSSGNVEKVAELKASDWAKKNYSRAYKLRNLHTEIAEVKNMGSEIHFITFVELETSPLFNDVRETPMGKGVLRELQGRNLNHHEKKEVEELFEDLNKDAAYGEYTGLFIEVVVCYDKNRKDWKLYYMNGIDNMLHNIDELSIDERKLYQIGRDTGKDLIRTAGEKEKRGYSNYDRFAARNYARKWTSNPTKCYDCGKSCGIKQDRKKWNNSVYPFDSIFKHNDCADFVSQAMSAGGLPEKSGWYRTKYSSKLDATLTWRLVTNMKYYMTVKHNYWSLSTYGRCNAGNIVITNNGAHIVMVDTNDGTTARFSGHTNDRKQMPLANNSNYTYYIINRN